MVILGVLVGVGLALCTLVPGVHAISLVMLLLPMLGGDSALIAASIAVGAGGVISVLHVAYHPTASSLLAHADLAAQLTYKGRGPSVIWVHTMATVQAFYGVLLYGGIALVFALAGLPLLRLMTDGLKVVSGVAVLLIMALVIHKAKRRLATFVVMLLAGLLGFIAFHLPALTGSEWGMTALLNGLFTLPAGWGLVASGRPTSIPVQEVDVDTNGLWPEGEEYKGMLLGILTGFLAGVGTGSLVGALRDEARPWKSLALSAAAEMSNNIWALLTFALVGSTRSGIAAAAAEAGAGSDAWGGVLILAGVGMGVFGGVQLLKHIQVPYRSWINSQNQQRLGWILLCSSSLLVVWHTGLVGLLVMLAAWTISSLAKSWHAPNQSLMMSLMGPVLLNSFGLTVSLAGGLGLV